MHNNTTCGQSGVEILISFRGILVGRVSSSSGVEILISFLGMLRSNMSNSSGVEILISFLGMLRSNISSSSGVEILIGFLGMLGGKVFWPVRGSVHVQTFTVEPSQSDMIAQYGTNFYILIK